MGRLLLAFLALVSTIFTSALGFATMRSDQRDLGEMLTSREFIVAALFLLSLAFLMTFCVLNLPDKLFRRVLLIWWKRARERRFEEVRTQLEAFAAAGRLLIVTMAHQSKPPHPDLERQENVAAFVEWHKAFVAYIATNLDSPSTVGRYATAAIKRGDDLRNLSEGVEIWTRFLEETAAALRNEDVRTEPRDAEEARLAATLLGQPLPESRAEAGSAERPTMNPLAWWVVTDKQPQSTWSMP